MGFSRQEYWSGVPLPSLGKTPEPSNKLICLFFVLTEHTIQIVLEMETYRYTWCSYTIALFPEYVFPYVCCFSLKLSWNNWITEIRCCSQYIILMVHIINITFKWWCKTWLSDQEIVFTMFSTKGNLSCQFFHVILWKCNSHSMGMGKKLLNHKSCPTLSDAMDCSLPGSSVHGIFQARVLEWGAIAFSDVYL